MKKLVLGVVLAVLLSTSTALAEGKCGDAPYRLGQSLIVTWVVPVPGDASVQQLPAGQCPTQLVAPHFDAAMAKHAAGRYANPAKTSRPGVPAGSGKRLELLPTAVMKELKDWEAQFNIPMDEEAEAAIQSYFDDQFKIYGAVVIHPNLKDSSEALRRSYSQCSCNIQRAVVVHDGTTERIYLQSHFLSARRRGDSEVPFQPDWCLLVTTKRATFWFPQRFNALVLPPTAQVSIDLLTLKAAVLKGLPAPLTATPAPDATFEGKSWKVQVIAGDVPTDVPGPKDLDLAF